MEKLKLNPLTDRSQNLHLHLHLQFTTVVANDQHVLHFTLPDDRNNHSYNLRDRRHELALTTKRDSRNFIERQYLKTCRPTDLSNMRLRSVNC